MKTRAAVAFEAKKPLEIVEVDLEGPKAGEVLVEIKATPAPDKSGNRINEFSMNISIKRAKAEESATPSKGAPAKPAGAGK